MLRDVSLIRAVGQAPNATPGLRRAAMVALALLGEAPAAADVARCQGGDILDGRAMLLAGTLSGAPISGMRLADASLALVARRLGNGRLLTALG